MSTGRGHTPFGYKIENGVAVVCEEQAAQLRKMYEGYLSGLSFAEAARAAGVTKTHSSLKRILQNQHLLGDDFYPAIIDRVTFDAFEAERSRREITLGRDGKERKDMRPVPAPTTFRMGKATQVYADPFRQAEYLYSLIESEV